MTIDVLDSATPIRPAADSDFFHALCQEWTNGKTVHDLMQREATDRVQHAYAAGHRAVVNHARERERQNTVTYAFRMMPTPQPLYKPPTPTFTPHNNIRATQPIKIEPEALPTQKSLHVPEVSHEQVIVDSRSAQTETFPLYDFSESGIENRMEWHFEELDSRGWGTGDQSIEEVVSRSKTKKVKQPKTPKGHKRGTLWKLYQKAMRADLSAPLKTVSRIWEELK
jgi:hypothetical protein